MAIRRVPKPLTSPTKPSSSAASGPVTRKALPLVVGQRVFHAVHGKARIASMVADRAIVQPEAGGPPRTVPLADLVSWKVHAKRAMTSPPPKQATAAPARQAKAPRSSAPSARPQPAVDPGTWYPVTRTLVVLARERGLKVEARTGGFSIRSTRSPFGELVRIREDATGAHTARAAASAGTSMNEQGRQVVAAVNREIARHLQRGLVLEARLDLVAYLHKAESHLEQAARHTRAERQARSEPRGPVSDGLGRWERKTWPGMVHIVQGGSPGLGRRS